MHCERNDTLDSWWECVKFGLLGRITSLWTQHSVEHCECKSWMLIWDLKYSVHWYEWRRRSIPDYYSNVVGSDDFWEQLRRLRKNQGQDLKKYFIQWLPFSAVQDSQRKVLTLINLRLFHIAAQLRIIDAQIYENLNQYLQGLTSNFLRVPDAWGLTLVSSRGFLSPISTPISLSNHFSFFSDSLDEDVGIGRGPNFHGPGNSPAHPNIHRGWANWPSSAVCRQIRPFWNCQHLPPSDTPSQTSDRWR